MRLSNYFLKTYKEYPSDEDIISQKLLVKAGYIKKHAQGIYEYLPLGFRSMEKIKTVIREEMDKIGFCEMQMPTLLMQEVYDKRIKFFGKEMFKIKDRTDKDLCLGPTHEEPFILLVKDALNSYKQLPIGLYQINNKYRDEIRPRFGLMRAKEFVMKDAYSYDKDEKALDVTYKKVKQAYNNIFNRVGLDFVPVVSDNGVMGGSASEEFMAKSSVGEADILDCGCGYAVNLEKVECSFEKANTKPKFDKKELVKTPNAKTVEQLVNFLNKNEAEFLKAIVYKADDKFVLALVRGDREVNETKLTNYLKCANLELASVDDFVKINSVAGFVGAFDLKNCLTIADNEVQNMVDFVIGANKTDTHYINANLSDLKIDKFLDLRNAVEGDKCPLCGKPMTMKKGIEVGHIFKNDTHYSERLGCTFLDENGKMKPVHTGCYGIGVGRTLSAIIEQNFDEKGIVLPENIAPYKYAILPVNIKDEKQMELAEKIYAKCDQNDALFDDRKDTFGFRMKDLELIGIPNIIVVGKNAEQGMVELYKRKTDEKSLIKIEDLNF